MVEIKKKCVCVHVKILAFLPAEVIILCTIVLLLYVTLIRLS